MVLHACGGNARCTTCRVEFIAGEPRHDDGRRAPGCSPRRVRTGVRLSCQIICDHDMTVRATRRLYRQRPPGSRLHARTDDYSAAGLGAEVSSVEVRGSKFVARQPNPSVWEPR